MARHGARALATMVAAGALAACGGGGGGGGGAGLVRPAPTPAPPPSPAGPLESAPFGLTQTTDFATAGEQVKFRWDASVKAYEVTLADGRSGRIVPDTINSGSGKLVAADGTVISYASMIVPFPLQYTRRVFLPDAVNFGGYLAFGLPAPAGSVPTSGSASFEGSVTGQAEAPGYGFSAGGPALLQFDFAAGSLTGHMDLTFSGPMDHIDGRRYSFSGMLTSVGATSFSGGLDAGGPSASWLRGQFTGPDAQELMASFEAPMLDFDQWGVIQGVISARRQ